MAFLFLLFSESMISISTVLYVKKTKYRVNLGLKRRIFMLKIHMLLCFYVFMFLGMLHSQKTPEGIQDENCYALTF